MSAENRPPRELYGRDETRAAIAALAPADMARLLAAAKTRAGGFKLDRVDLGVRDLVGEAIADTLSGRRRWRRDVPLIEHLIMTMKSIASRRRERRRAAVKAGFRVERRGTMMPGLLEEGEGVDGKARPAAAVLAEDSEEERIIAEDRIRVFLRHFAGDPAALEVIQGWRMGEDGKEIREHSGLTEREFKAAARRVRRFAERLGDDADGG